MHNKYNKNNTTHFGFKTVSKNTKTSMVSDVFHNIAEKYDLMNDLMSYGIHRIWKKILVYHSEMYRGCKILDLAGGTGDLSIQFSKIVGNTGIVVLVDINHTMLKIGQKKIRNLGILNNILYIQANAESLPFSDNTFDCISIAFGLRNFTNKEKALSSIYRVLKPGGKLLILDFSVPNSKIINKMYNFYSFHILPKIGEFITQQAESYHYLVESIRMHPNPNTLKHMILDAGFNNVEFFNMTCGIVALHYAYKQ